MTNPLTVNSDVRWFPIITDRMARPRGNKIPWRLAEIVYEGYSRRYGTDQSLERIAERGGFGILEIADHLLATIDALRQENTGLKRTGVGVSGLLIDSTLTADIRIKALEWLVGEKNKATGCEKVKLRKSRNCLAVHRFPCEPCRVLALTEADYPGQSEMTGKAT